MMTFTRVPARDVRPGALVMIDHDSVRVVFAIREVSESATTVSFTAADYDRPLCANRAELVWIAQR